MREAAVPGYRLVKSKRSTKVLISCALVAVLLGLLSAVALTLMRTGISPASVTEYFLGGPADQSLGGMNLGNGPRPLGELAEVTHLHLMGGGLLLFLLCHLLALCELGEAFRTALYLTAFGSFILTFASPWGIIYLHPACSWIYGPAVILLIASLLLSAFLPLKEMWGDR